MKRRVLIVAGILLLSLAVSACGGSTKDPVDMITSAAVEETTVEETSATEETGAELSDVTVMEAGPGVEAKYIYQQIDDEQVHKVTYWTDGETRRTNYFKNLYLPEWGVEKITLPSDLVDGEPYVLKPGEEITAENAKDDQIYDDSVNYAGNFSIRTAYEYFRVWRVNVGRQVDLLSMKPEPLHYMIYNFQDASNYLINLDHFWEYKDEEGNSGYILEVMDRGHWEKPVAYRSYILVRVEDGIAHCMQYGDATPYAKEKWDYILTTAKFTKIRDITEGDVCDAGK